MSLLHPTGPSFADGEEKSSFNLALDPATASMRGDTFAPASQVPTALAAHEDARVLVRLIQCPRCSRPYQSPVTLPCGHSLCRSCLPPSHARSNISYPNTPDRQHGIRCTIHSCGTDHPVADCNIDVTLLKVMDSLREEVARHIPGDEDDQSPLLVEELTRSRSRNSNSGRSEASSSSSSNRSIDTTVSSDSDELGNNGDSNRSSSSSSPSIAEEDEMTQTVVQSENKVPVSWTLQGGRLLACFTLAEMGELPLNMELNFRSLSDSGDSYERRDVALLNRLREATYRELDCHVCYNMMLDPVTTGCGHTFCRKCLARALDHSTHCPVCRRSLRIPPSLERQASNGCLKALLNGLCPELVAARARGVAQEEHAVGSAESEIPIFVCTLAFPGMPTFLHIFEPRYRLMIRRAMEGNRQFGMVLYNRAGLPQGNLGRTPFLEYGTILEIVNIEYMADGRSYVETRGVSRFRVRSHDHLDGYLIGNVERVEDISLAEEERLEASETSAAIAALSTIHQSQQQQTQSQPAGDNNAAFNAQLDRLSTRELLLKGVTFIERMRALSADWLSQRIVAAYGGPPDDPALFPYWFACVLPIAEEEKYLLLQTTSVRERLKIVNRWIRRIESQRCLITLSGTLRGCVYFVAAVILALWAVLSWCSPLNSVLMSPETGFGPDKAAEDAPATALNSNDRPDPSRLIQQNTFIAINIHAIGFPTDRFITFSVSLSLCITLAAIVLLPIGMMYMTRSRDLRRHEPRRAFPI